MVQTPPHRRNYRCVTIVPVTFSSFFCKIIQYCNKNTRDLMSLFLQNLEPSMLCIRHGDVSLQMDVWSYVSVEQISYTRYFWQNSDQISSVFSGRPVSNYIMPGDQLIVTTVEDQLIVITVFWRGVSWLLLLFIVHCYDGVQDDSAFHTGCTKIMIVHILFHPVLRIEFCMQACIFCLIVISFQYSNHHWYSVTMKALK